MVKDGAFRQDLYYRLSAFPVVIPPLREHPEDIPQLTEHFLDHFRRELGRPELRMSPEAMAWLAVQPWPGNVRELMNRIERAAILAPSDGGIGVEGMGAGEGSTAPAGMPALSAIEDPESWLEAETSWRAAELLRRCQGDRRRTARLLGLTQVQLDRLTGGGG
jgi:DNA-binding NtrC family response regulator